jgi:diguanylate cyclase (GGDEF)-like protein
VNETSLADLLAEFAHTLVGGFQIQEILDHLVARIVDVLPVTGAGVMVMGPAGELHFVAASNDTILEIESLQNELGEGPCLTAYRTGAAVAVPDLSEDTTFPRFSARAQESALAAVFTFPMSIDGTRFGALDLYRDEPGALSAPDMRSAQVLADVAAAYIHNAQGRADALDTLDVLRQRSLHDPLTGLPNRTLLKERLEQAVARTTRSHDEVAVLFVDLDRFKAINDRYGHLIGDKLLIAVADRLTGVLRAGDTLARLSGDEFIIMCEGLEHEDPSERVAERVVSVLAPPFDLEGHRIQISASVGVAFCGPGEEVPESLLRDADHAMYQAKKAGGGRHALSDSAARLEIDRRGLLGRELRVAQSRNEFRLAYQPLVDAKGGSLVAVEALLRWQHPTRGWVQPDELLPIAEGSGLILDIGEWVLAQACRDLKSWQERFGPVISHVTVNVSPLQVMAPGFDTTVARVLETTGTDPVSVSLEVTESAFLEDGPRALTMLEKTKEVGVGLILDDFGTGYSSLSYLRRFPFDVLKIDQVFVENLTNSDGTRKIVAAIIDLAHGLDMAVVAEGIETRQQLTQVRNLGSDRVQGFYLCRPLLSDQIEKRILEPAATTPVRLPLSPSSALPAPRRPPPG